ncbi:hypothetical protein AVEN_246803-1 [Araneus ventricosus]|uniref:Uncharacterized protein n=1 Tax=Araneus ventricosus TaxID=182803 RepID=A0A4Y2MSW7_ARAVE|nr:hypothetical protein AVEN_246803-1 [Araneus ventricosus]
MTERSDLIDRNGAILRRFLQFFLSISRKESSDGTGFRLHYTSDELSTTPELARFSPKFRYTTAGGRLTRKARFNPHQAHIHGVSSVETCFEPGALR